MGPKGDPNRVNPSETSGIFERRGSTEKLAGAAISDLDRFRSRPRGGPMMDRAAARSSSDPHRVPSSRYQALIKRPGTSRLIRSTTGWRASANPKGPRGSPCCTP